MSSSELVSKSHSTVGKVALGLSIAGFVSAIVPGLSFFAWILILAAFIVSIVALAKKGTKKTFGVVGLILSIVSGVVAVVVSLVTALAVVAGAASEVSDNMTATSDEIQGGIGQVVSTSDGAEITINSVSCGETEFEGQFGTEQALGQFCVVTFKLDNPSSEPIFAFTNDFGGLVGDTNVEASSSMGVGGFDPDNSMSIELNPGLSVTGTVVIDIAAGASLDAVTFGGMSRDEIAISSK